MFLTLQYLLNSKHDWNLTSETGTILTCSPNKHAIECYSHRICRRTTHGTRLPFNQTIYTILFLDTDWRLVRLVGVGLAFPHRCKVFNFHRPWNSLMWMRYMKATNIANLVEMVFNILFNIFAIFCVVECWRFRKNVFSWSL